jgi:alkylation response protein AidB-like acyl-CoA dehydrogenase
VIDLRLDPDEEMIRATARAFARDRLLPAMRAHEAQGGVHPDVVRAYRALGFAAMEAPEAAGGRGASPLAKALVLEELGAGDAGAALALEGAGPALRALVELDERGLVRRLADEPDLRVALACDPEGRLALRGGGVTGSHPWAPVPPSGAAVVVVLQADRLVLVRDGVRSTPVKACGLAAAGSSQLDFEGARVAAETADPAAIARAWAHARLFVAALLVGVARAAAEYAMRYAQERTAFGRPIAHHQGLAFLLADMATAVEAARLAVWRGTAALADGHAAREAAWALAEAAEQALFVGPAAVQVLGGHGFMRDHPVEKWMRDIRALAQLGGGRDEAELAAAACEV